MTPEPINALPAENVEKLLDYAEAQSAENFQFHIESAAILAKEAVTTFSWLIPVIGASVAFCISSLVNGYPPSVVVAVGSMAVYLLFAGRRLVLDALMAGDIPAPGNEPKNLLKHGEVNLIRRANLATLQSQIDRIRKRNADKGRAINNCRRALLTAPVVCVITGTIIAVILKVYSD